MSTNFVDVKITTWERYWFSDETNMQEIKEQILEGVKVWEIEGASTGEIVLDTSEIMSPEENDGLPTLEIFEDGEVIYNNVEGDIKKDESDL